MDIVIVTGMQRPYLLAQTIRSINTNSIERHNVVLVCDGCWEDAAVDVVIRAQKIGASRCRNIGASSIPKYLRQNLLTFLDDDVYVLPGWDQLIQKVSAALLHTGAVSGHAHPFNHPTGRHTFRDVIADRTSVLSTLHMSMPWAVWDAVGFFAEPGGPGGSEDVDWCKRATGLPLVTTVPQCVIHCGLTNSKGERIVGYEHMVEQNKQLVEQYKVEVTFE